MHHIEEGGERDWVAKKVGGLGGEGGGEHHVTSLHNIIRSWANLESERRHRRTNRQDHHQQVLALTL